MKLLRLVRGRRQAHNPTLAKIMRLTYNRSCSHNRPQTAACNAVYSISRRALLITRLGEQLPRPRQVSMPQIGATVSPEQRRGKNSYGEGEIERFFRLFLHGRADTPAGVVLQSTISRNQVLTPQLPSGRPGDRFSS